jgi:hypothetical protein
MHGRNDKCIKNFLRNLKGGECLEFLDANGKTVLKWILKNCDVSLWNWINMAQDRDWWQAMNVWIPRKVGN